MQITKKSELQGRVLKTTRIPAGNSYVPGFKIAGKWLQNLGYKYGDLCRISVMADGSLNISKIGGEK
jgi:hypothetical protein